MHTQRFGEFIVHHNGDFSGDVEIYRTDKTPEPMLVAKLPFWLLKYIVAKKVRLDRIAALENANTDKLLGIRDDGAVMD
jgi:hypothetical protein